MKAIAFRHVLQDWDSFGYARGKNMSAFKPDGGKWELTPGILISDWVQWRDRDGLLSFETSTTCRLSKR
jgi:hypothetical protein